MLSSQNKKRFIIAFLIVFLFTSSIGILSTKQVKAQGGAVISTEVVSVPETTNWWADTIKWVKEKVWDDIMSFAVKRTLQMYMEKLAYNAATWVAEGIEGGDTAWSTDSWKKYMADARDSTTAEFLDSLATGMHLDICEPPGGVNLKLNLSLSLDTPPEEKKPRCSLNDIKDKWGDLSEKMKEDPYSLMKLNDESLSQLGFGQGSSPDEIRVKILQNTISVEQTDLGYIQYTQGELDLKKMVDLDLVEKERTDSDDPKPKRSPISKHIEVPGSVSGEKLKKLQDANEDSANNLSGNPLADSANIFLNTLVSKSISKLILKMFKPIPPQYGSATENGGLINPLGSLSQSRNQSIVEKTFASIKKISYNINPTDIDIISKMEIDLGGDIAGEMNNGTIDSDFAEVLRKAQGGQILTLREAIDENLVDQNKWFGYIDVASQDPKQPSVAEGFSANNIKKLVKNRVVSVGWIFAAEIIKAEKGDIGDCSSQGCTLENVLDEYDKSGTYQIDEEIYQDEYCGWRSISAEPYYIDINNGDDCNEEYLSDPDNGINLTGVDVKWVGQSDSIPGICYEYQDTSNPNPLDGVIDDISAIGISTQAECENNLDLTENKYYKWEPGGCLVKESDESPLCHLVDPNIVLKAPAQQCGAEGYYSILEIQNTSSRQKDCADVKHCIQENDDGKCVGGYDYCIQEENIWRFSGDACSKQFNSCTTLIDDQGKQESYLIETLKNCPQEEVGCRDYVLTKENTEDEYIWDNDGAKIYFNDSVEECNANAGGCSEFIEITPGVNLIPNGSFEINEGPEDEKPDGWSWFDLISQGGFTLVKDAYVGNYSLQHTASDFDSLFTESEPSGKRLFQVPHRGLYTFSYYVKSTDSVASVVPSLEFYDNQGVGSTILNLDANFSGATTDGTWQRVSGYFSIPEVIDHMAYVDLRLQISGDIQIDALQFELNELGDGDLNEGEGQASAYREYGQTAQNYFKKAPDYLNCEDYSLNSYNCDQEYHPCCDYVKYCPAEDLSCSAYYPTNGDPFVPAVIENEDKCVAECNNYQTFAALPSYFDNLESMEDDGVEAETSDSNFIPDTAQDCSEPSCELFTNIDKLESGAESKEYYSAVRQCVKPDDAGVVTKLYYTWEGSDTSAFQLKTWKLLASDIEDNFSAEGGYAPCINVSIGTATCNDNIVSISDIECDPETNLDCRTFYDENAVPHNRLLSRTIPITDECINLRRELSNQVYKIAPSMSQTCGSANVGCITYQGNNSNNVRNIFMEDFESGSTIGWMADLENATKNVHLVHSSESIHYNGNSMKVFVSDNSNSIWLYYNLTKAGRIILPNKQYTLSFWAKSFGDNFSTPNLAQIQASANDSFLSFDNNLIVVDQEWSLYEYNIVDFTTDETGDIILKFKININNNIYDYDGVYLDNIILKGLINSFDKIKDSWETPRVCLDNDYLGCQEYRDSNNDLWYLYQFSDLCPEENIGCTAMIDTQNSSMAFQQTFNAYCGEGSLESECDLGKYYYQNYDSVSPGSNEEESTVVVLSDELVYLVKDNAYGCISGDKGCQEMAIIDNDGASQDIYVVNNPDYYIPYDIYGGKNGILCLDEYMNCVSFNTLEGSKLHKIHPRNLTCTYQIEDVEKNISAGFYTKEGDNCTGLLYNQDYDQFTSNIVEEWKPYTAYDNQYAALCPAEENSCSGFIDPLDNLDFSDYVYSHLGISLNYNNPSEWKQAIWSKLYKGSITHFSSDGISYHPASSDDDYEGLNVVLDNNHDLLVYRGPDYDQSAFFFNVKADTTYRLSARVKLNDVDSVMTFLSCRPSTLVNGEGDQTDIDGYFVDEEWYQNENQIPYAFPAIKSNYGVDNSSDDWQYIYGLYEILPGAHYCNMAFYINGEADSKITIADINLEKVEGDYYYLDNDQINYDDCNSASLKEGCILFHNITNSELKWNHEKSYDENRLGPGNPQTPSDANVLLKVTRDKQCAEWLTCGASLRALDSSIGQVKDACISLIACDELSDDKAGICAHPFLHGQDAQPLTLDYYHQMRGKSSWADLDYSGYSIPGLYPLDALTPMEISDGTSTSTVLGHTVVQQDSNGKPFVYKLGVGVDNYLQNYSQDIYLLDSFALNTNLIEKSCRLYPEKDSPFPWIKGSEIVIDPVASSTDGNPYVDIQNKFFNFENANICQTGSGSDLEEYPFAEGQDCECHYTKANYGSETLYFPYDYDHIPTSINIDYGGGVSSNFSSRSQTKYLGWKGFCLDEEQSLFINNTDSLPKYKQDYRCLSWYPIDLLSGEMNAYATSPEAEVSVDKVGDHDKLCVVGEDYVITEDRVYCSKFYTTSTGTHCTILSLIPAGTKINVDKIDEYSSLVYSSSSGNNTWLDASNFVYEEDPEDISNAIIRKSDPSNCYKIADNHENTNCVTNNQFTRADFGNIEGDDFKDVISSLFDAGGNIAQFYIDENVNSSGHILPGVHFYLNLVETSENGGGNCGSCGYNGIDACVESGQHEVDRRCDQTVNCGPFASWRNRYRWCNPRTYNYYVNIVSEDYFFNYYTGHCGNNCKFENTSSINHHGRGCLRDEGMSPRYYDLLNNIDYIEEDVWNLNLCKDGEEGSENDLDCEFVNCVENLTLNDNGDHTCSSYNDCLEGYILYDVETESWTSNFSEEMFNDYSTCFLQGVSGSLSLPEYGIYDSQAFCATSFIMNCDSCPSDNSCCSSEEGCGENCPTYCCICENNCISQYWSWAADYNYDTEISDTDCDDSSNTCAKTCQTYIDLNKAVVYNSNNFYLNWLEPELIFGDGTGVDEVCKPDGNNDVCADVLSGNINNYAGEERIRFADVSSSTDSFTEWAEVSSPFSANVIQEESVVILRNLIYIDNRSGSNTLFNDYYADSNAGEALNVAKDRLENVVVKVPNSNFHDYDDNDNDWNDYPIPDWSGTYWDRSTSIDPIIKQTVHDEINGFYEGDSGISINSNHERHIIGRDGNLYAYLMFYGYAATGTTPIQEIVIDWTGLNVDKLVLKGPFKNHKHDCVRKCGVHYRDIDWDDLDNIDDNCVSDLDCNSDDSEITEYCFAQTWGDHENACIEDDQNKFQDGFFSYSYIYTCDALNDYWREDCRNYDSDIQGGCCIYTPAVTITDSWGNSKTEDLGNCNNGLNTCSVIVVPR